MLNLLLSNYGLIARIAGVVIIAAIIGGLWWRVDYLSTKAEAQHIELIKYKESFNEMRRLSELRETITTRNLNNSLEDERKRADILARIERDHATDNAPAAAVLTDTIDRLYGN